MNQFNIGRPGIMIPDYFISPASGRISFEDMMQQIIAYLQDEPKADYRIIIGTDSLYSEKSTSFVTAIIVHRVGKGARYFYCREREWVSPSLRQRIFLEASRSLAVASAVMEYLASTTYADMNIEIHLDIGEQGDTKELIREVVGMVVGSGFDARIKPESFAASKVADKYTR